MKIRLALILLVFLMKFSATFAQHTMGIKGGYSHSWPSYGEAILPEGAKTDVDGFNAVISYYIPINKYLKIGVEPGFVKRGAACFPGW